MPFSIGSADLSVLVGMAEVVLCSEDHTSKESQQRYLYVWYQYLDLFNTHTMYIMTLELVMEL